MDYIILCLTLLHEVKYHFDKGKQKAQPELGLFV